MIKTISIDSVGKVTFRPMSFIDVPKVFEVEKSCYEFPWTQKLINDCVAVGYSCWVVEFDQQIIGYAIYRLAVGEAHLFNIAIHPEFQNKRICRSFLGYLLKVMRNNLADKVMLEVRVSNQPARKLYKDFGFEEVGVRKGYYPDKNNTREDGLNLELVFR